MYKQIVNTQRVVYIVSILTLSLPYASVNADGPLSMELTGKVEPVCTIESSDSTKVDLSAENKQSLLFNIYCNTEMTIGLQSINGGMLNISRDSGNDNTPVLYPYEATVSLTEFDFLRTFSSDILLQGVTTEVEGGVVFEDQMEIAIEMASKLEDGYAGAYTDSISISIFPSLAVSLN